MSDAPTPALLQPLALCHVGINVGDLERSTRYYQRVFGLRVFYDNDAPAGQDRVVIGLISDVAVELTQKAQGPASSSPVVADGLGFASLTFTVADVDAAYRALEAEGLANLAPPATLDSGVRVALFRDPDGNLLEVIDLGGPKSLAEMAMAAM